MSVIGAIIVGFFAGLIARWVTPGSHKPSGFILTTVLGMVGAMVATFLGQQLGIYHAGDSAGFVGAIVGSVVILLAWSQLARQRAFGR